MARSDRAWTVLNRVCRPMCFATLWLRLARRCMRVSEHMLRILLERGGRHNYPTSATLFSLLRNGIHAKPLGARRDIVELGTVILLPHCCLHETKLNFALSLCQTMPSPSPPRRM